MMSKTLLVSTQLAALALGKLVVYSPKELVDLFATDSGVINANYANFGHIPYGQSLIGSISYDPANSKGCNIVEISTIESQGQPAEIVDAKKTKIVLVDRGQCSFVTKVRNAERQGASLVVVVDNRTEDVTNVVMGDDGTGTGIRVPSMLIGS